MPSFDSVVVGEEFISEHYFTTDSTKESFQGRVLERRKEWDAESKEGRATSRSRLLAESGALQTALAVVGEDRLTMPDTYALVRRALGWPETMDEVRTDRGSDEIRVPNTSPVGVPGTLWLQADPVDSIEDLVAKTGTLRVPVDVADEPLAEVPKAVSELFHSDLSPAYVIIQAGRWLVLTEKARWAEGRYLAADLLLIAERRHEARGGEIDRVATVFGREAFAPEADGSVWWDATLEQAVKHTAAVSTDLREGIRESIEIVANDVVERRAAQHVAGEIEAQQLALHSLRFLYRILFLLYAEASPELEVLPVGEREYAEGYGVDRLRDLTLVSLTSPDALNGTHLYDSLEVLFRLVDQGWPPYDRDPAEAPSDHDADGPEVLRFNALRSDLFAQDATSLVSSVGLSNACLQQVLERLLLTKESRGRKGRDRGFISYADLSINQLGAVYEGLMSYTGFFADEDLHEVAKAGDPSKGSWVVPARASAHLDEADFVRDEDPLTGELRPRVHERGSFVFRLAGRERQQSASYYTPEVLTKFVVEQSLAELLDQDGHSTTSEEILDLRVCEPALGSGAFAIEAVRQLATEFLRRRESEVGEQVPPEEWQREWQRAKAYIALHQVYGVDLNSTAVELAEISLWLDTMVAGLRAPWFGLHLQRGNSLIGARHSVYSPDLLAKRAWQEVAATDVPLGGALNGRIHHFLLPTKGWGAIVDTAETKTYAERERERLRLWRKDIRKAPTKDQGKRLIALAGRVEVLWQIALRRLTIADREIRRDITLWGDDAAGRVGGSEATRRIETTPAVDRAEIERALADSNGAYQRLRLVMDAWCALWSWPLDAGTKPPTWDGWLAGLETLLGVETEQKTSEAKGAARQRLASPDQARMFETGDWHELGVAEYNDRVLSNAKGTREAVAEHPWLGVVQTLAKAQGYFHWELDFAPVFARGGFDLQVGNPPWVRPDWDEAAALAEFDPWWQLSGRASEAEKRGRRADLLADESRRRTFLYERTLQSGTIEHLGSGVDRPALTGLRPDLYRCFMERTWRSLSPRGVVGLIHPESHFTEQRAALLRRETYPRLRRHFRFHNNTYQFPEIGHKKTFGVHIYGKFGPVRFTHAAWLFAPSVATRSLLHDGMGDAPSIEDPTTGTWDLRPHAQRLIDVDAEVLGGWATLIDEPGTPPTEARVLYPVNSASAVVLDKLSAARRLGDNALQWTPGWNETTDRKRGYFSARADTPDGVEHVILQGPHLTVANPVFQQPDTRPGRGHLYTAIDHDTLPADFIPRTNYQPRDDFSRYEAAYPYWKVLRPTDDDPLGIAHAKARLTPADETYSSASVFRLAWREMADTATVRTLQSALLPPGPTHVHAVNSCSLPDHRSLAVFAGTTHSIVADFMVKVIGNAHINTGTLSRLPLVLDHHLEAHLNLRTLRLNCLVQPYAPLWEELYDEVWTQDAWVPGVGVPVDERMPLGQVGPTWEWATPLRRAADRRQALVEIDAIVAIMLGITAEELSTIYRTQFPVLQKYEREALYDATGREVPAPLAKLYRKQSGRVGSADLTVADVTYTLPFHGVDRDHDMQLAHKHFSGRLTPSILARRGE